MDKLYKREGRRFIPASTEEVYQVAENALWHEYMRGEAYTSPDISKKYLIAHFSDEKREHFTVIFLDSQHRPLATERMFSGTINAATVHPREIARRSLELNAAAVILGHNHPSGVASISEADRRITRKIVETLELLDVKVLDHIVVGSAETVSFAQEGLL